MKGPRHMQGDPFRVAEDNMNHYLSIILFTPLVGALLILLINKQNENAIRWVANIAALAGFLVSVPLWFKFDPTATDFQFVERASWIPSVGAEYFLGVDGLSTLLILLTTMMGSIAVLSSWTAITERVKEYYIFLLILQTGMLGAFMSLDFLLFFLFWEVMLVPMYFLIGIWGSANRLYSAIKFFLYTLVGSVVMLLGILALYFYNHSVTNVYTFDVTQFHRLSVPFNLQWWVFLAFFLGIVYERRHTREISEYGGLSKVMPVYAAIFLIMTMSSIGLPTLNGFIGELMILQGAFVASKAWAAFAASGVVLGAAFMLNLYQRT